MGFVWGHVESFLHSVASPFHSFVTTIQHNCGHVKELKQTPTEKVPDISQERHERHKLSPCNCLRLRAPFLAESIPPAAVTHVWPLHCQRMCYAREAALMEVHDYHTIRPKRVFKFYYIFDMLMLKRSARAVSALTAVTVQMPPSTAT